MPNSDTIHSNLPVLYMLDGGVQEDFPHLANTLSKLISSKKINPHILVGIQNTERRRDLTGVTNVKSDLAIAKHVGESEKFRNFILKELFPEIQKRYNPSNKKSIIGESLAGLFVIETFLTNRNMFDNYIAFDPSLWWNDHQLVKDANDYLIQKNNKPTKLWFASSSATDIVKHTKSLENILKSTPNLNLNWLYTHMPKEKHQTIFKATKEQALVWTLN